MSEDILDMKEDLKNLDALLEAEKDKELESRLAGTKDVVDEILARRARELQNADAESMVLAEVNKLEVPLENQGEKTIENRLEEAESSELEAVARSAIQAGEEKAVTEGAEWNELKVVFLGDGGVGKSRIVARWLNGGRKLDSFDGNTTPGIAIHKHKCKLSDGRMVQANIWDFGGQEILDSMHRMFLTERTLYVLVLDARTVRDDTKDTSVQKWLRSIRSAAGDCPLLIVINKTDECNTADVDFNTLKKIYPALKDVAHLSALEDPDRLFESSFMNKIEECMKDFDWDERALPPSWHKFRLKMQSMKDAEDYVLSGRTYKLICNEYGVTEEEHWEMLKYMGDLGVCFCYQEHTNWDRFIILDPEWITNAVYSVLWNIPRGSGVINEKKLGELVETTQRSPELNGVKVRDDFGYTGDDVQYALGVFRKFKLSFELNADKNGNRREFIPALCVKTDGCNKRNDELYVQAVESLEFRLEYEHLPTNLLYQLMVEMKNELCLSNVWATGARFVKCGQNRECENGATHNCGQGQDCASALIRIEGDHLCIYVRGNELISAGQYLEEILHKLDCVHNVLGLNAKKQEVAYKKADPKVYFSYVTLNKTLKAGQSVICHDNLDDPVPIRDILMQMDYDLSHKQKVLLDDITIACEQMQGNKTFWHPRADVGKPRENKRNTSVRDALNNLSRGRSNYKFVAFDQTLRGTGDTGSQEGELDIMVQDGGKDWVIIEAVNITGKDKANWNKHLKKLLDNYNPMGLEMLVLVDYVECTKDEYTDWRNSYDGHIKKHAPEDYKICAGTYKTVQVDTKSQYMDVRRCVYTRGGKNFTVYHYFVRIHADK